MVRVYAGDVCGVLGPVEPEVDGTQSEVFIVLNFERKLVLIGGSKYAGEIKKSIFTTLSYLLPLKGVLGMHCSANVGPDGDSDSWVAAKANQLCASSSSSALVE